MSSISDSESPQSKTYVAGFVARAISKVGLLLGQFQEYVAHRCFKSTIVDCYCIFTLQEVVSFSDIAPTFDQGAHHPTVLVVLQAMVALIGEVCAHLCPRAGGAESFPGSSPSCWVGSWE